MSAERSFLGELLRRRVPQIVGMYVAATWMMVEIGDWAIERFGLPQELTLLAFVALAAMLPSVVLIAYNHGAPGRDRWRTVEKTVLPINAVLALAAVWALVPDGEGAPPGASAPAPPSPPLVTRKRLIDEQGRETVVEVPTVDYFERVAIYPWMNGGPEEDAWLAYGIPILLEEDIDRGHYLGVDTLFAVASADELRKAGFPDGRDLPRALRVSLARERGNSWLVEGRFARQAEGGFTLGATLTAIAGNREVARFETTGADLLAALDEVADWLGRTATPELPGNDGLPDLAIAEHFTQSLSVAERYVSAMRAQFFENDYETALAELAAATDADPTFAAGFLRMAILYRLSGKPREAMAALDRTLALDYKLASEERFLVKAERYGISGQSEKAIRVLEMLTEVHPNSAVAFRLLGGNYMILSRTDEAMEAFQRVRKLDPSDDDVLLTLADLSQMKGDFARAQGLIEEYLAANPSDAAAVRKLAALDFLAGDPDAAREDLERASLLASDDFEAELGLAKLAMWQADFAAAEQRLASLLARSPEPARRVQLGLARIQLLQLQGRIEAGLAELDALAEPAQRSLAPVEQIFSLQSQRAAMMTMLGRHQAALAEIAAVAEQVQPPMDGFFVFSRMAVYQEMEDVAGLRAALDDATRFAEEHAFPFLEPFIQIGLAQLARLEGRAADGVTYSNQAVESFRSSMLGLQEPYLIGIAQVERAANLRAAGQLEDARSTVREHLRRYPADGVARIEYARILLASGDRAGADAELEAVRQLWSQADADYIGLDHIAELEAELEADVAAAG